MSSDKARRQLSYKLNNSNRPDQQPDMNFTFIADSARSFTVPLSQLHAQHPGKRLVVGVAIVASIGTIDIDSDMGASQKKILIVQRAETEDIYPLMYELPGGGAEPQDATLLDTVVRETKEETGLTVTRILGRFPGFEYETSKSRAIQFNFLVGVEEAGGLNVRLNPEEHCAFTWVNSTDELSRYNFTADMGKVVSDALAAMEAEEA